MIETLDVSAKEAKAERKRIAREAAQEVMLEIGPELDAMRSRIRLMAYKHLVVTEVCYSARHRTHADIAAKAALDAVLAMDWPDEWWVERMEKESPGNGNDEAQLTVVQWAHDIGARAAELREAGVWR